MQPDYIVRCGTVSPRQNERGVALVVVLSVVFLLMGVGSTALFSGYTSQLTSTNLRIAARARTHAETGINEALYRLSRQETDPVAIVPDLSDSNWRVTIDFTNDDNNFADGRISTILATADWPAHTADDPVVVRFKKPDPVGSPNDVLFYDRTQSPPFRTITLPAANIPNTARPVIQILATALDDRGAERRILAEAASTVAFAPPAPLSSGVDVNLNGSGFIDGVNHDHRIYITAGGGASAVYGDGNSETTDSNSPSKDSPDDNSNTGGTHGIANPCLTSPAYSSYARLFNKQISSTDTAPAWVGLAWNAVTSTWCGGNHGYASAIALSNNGVGGPTVTNDQPPVSGVWTRGVFTWGRNNGSTSLTGTIPPAGTTTNCSPAGTPGLVCRPAELSHGPDSFDPGQHFPYFQEFLGLDDVTFQNLLDRADTTRADLDAGRPPLGFTYIQGNYTFNNSTASPGTNDFGLLYVTGNLAINGNQTFKGLIYIDGSLSVSGNPTILGAIMVRGSTQITAGTGNMTLLYSRKAAELGIQAANPWRILSWTDAEMQ